MNVAVIPARGESKRILKKNIKKFRGKPMIAWPVEGLAMAGVLDYAENNHWMNLLQIDSETYGAEREELMQRLGENGIQSRPVLTLNHLQKPYENCQSYKIDHAIKSVDKSLCLPSSVSLGKKECEMIVNKFGLLK